MDAAKKALVQSSWARVEPIADVAANLFYTRLFELDPSLDALFDTDIEEQGRKLMSMIGLAVRGLDDLDELAPAVESLGRRHAGYGVEAHHYETVATAFLDTLATGLGEAFTPEVREAWTETYLLLADLMKAAAEQQVA